ncbi:SulP family inorganic anion transporter [Shimazuella sp. AN120528]|uniref:SulP family inorganic anion transporter n=1 Tax=Shimazuella soli TaxID=1892854 RepID=UPI001F0ED3A4|nr:SulP family inorganic anion transporter [Shimazuella soli]MCH5583977.1 SulP family inorganic anion transporter [Shimazuella soli]
MFRVYRFQNYSWARLRKDVIAGIVVGIVALPLAMAIAIASGVRPEYGLYTTIIAGFLISLFGGSFFQIGGPTATFVPVLLGLTMVYGYENLLLAGLLSGGLLVLMGIFRLGAVIHYIPKPVTIGFTAGIAVIIFSSQIHTFLGMENIKDGHILYKLKQIFVQLHTISLASVGTALICLLVIFLVQKFLPQIPAPLVGLIVSSFIATWFYPSHVQTIGSAFGGVPSTLPSIHLPEITWSKFELLFFPALSIALLGAIESLLSAVVSDGMSGKKHHSNRELIGQGVANIVTPFFGGIPAAGAIARTATNIRNGATSPVSGIVHSIFVLLVLLFLSPLTMHVPLASMAPILMLVAWNMSERKEFKFVLRSKTSDSIVLCATFLCIVLTDIAIGVMVGLGLSILFFVFRMSNEFVVRKANVELQENEITHVYTLKGPIFFGTAKQLAGLLAKDLPKDYLILSMEHVPYMDITAEAVLSSIIRRCKQHQVKFILAGLQTQPLELLQTTRLYQSLDEKYIFKSIEEAKDYAKQLEIQSSPIQVYEK